jgi:hypothetical protein
MVLPLCVALWLVPIYEKMHEETDRLSYLKNDWSEHLPLIDLRLTQARPYSNKTTVLEDTCFTTFGPQYFKIEPAKWNGMAMGCNCTD